MSGRRADRPPVNDEEELRGRVAKARDVYRHRGFAGIEEASQVLERVVQVASSGLTDVHSEALVEWAANRRRARHLDYAEELARRALGVSTSTGNRLDQASAHVELARIGLSRNSHDAADRHLRRARELAGSRDPGLSARILYSQAKMARRCGDLPNGRPALVKAIHLYEEAGDSYGKARSLALLGYMDRVSGALDRALESLGESLALAKQHGFPLVEANAQLELGQIARVRRKYELALWHTHTAFVAFWLMGDTIGVAHTHGAFAVLYRLTGDTGLLHAATNYARAAVNIYVAAGHTAGEALSRRRLGECLRDARRYAEARVELEKALAIYETLERSHDEALVLAALAKLERAQQQSSAALELAREAKKRLDVARKQFRNRQDNAMFGTRYAWVYAVALVCALESGSSEADSQLAALLQEGALRRAAREQLSRLSGKIGSLIGEIADCQASLGDNRLSEEEEAVLKQRLARLCHQLERQAPNLAQALDIQLPFSDVWTAPGVHVLALDAQGNDAAWVAWNPPRGDTISDIRRLSPANRKCLAELAAGTRDARWDARPQRLQRLAEALLPEDLQAALLNGEVSVLRLVPSLDLRRVPFGELRLGERALDELTSIVWVALPPSDERAGPDDRMVDSPPFDDGGAQKRLDGLSSVGVLVRPSLDTATVAPSMLPELKKIRLDVLFDAEPELTLALRADVAALQEDGVSLASAVRTVKARHRRHCGRTCSPAHVGGLVVTVEPDADLADEASAPSKDEVADRPRVPTVASPARAIDVGYEPGMFLVSLDAPDSDDIDIVVPARGVELVFDAASLGQLLRMRVRVSSDRPDETWVRTVSTLLGPTLWKLFQGFAAAQQGDRVRRMRSKRIRLDSSEWATLRQVVWSGLHHSISPGLIQPPLVVPAEPVSQPRSLVVMASLPRSTPDVPALERPGGNFPLPESVSRSYHLGSVGYVAMTTPSELTVRFDATDEACPLTVHLNLPSGRSGPARYDDDQLIARPRFDRHPGRNLSLCLDWPSGEG